VVTPHGRDEGDSAWAEHGFTAEQARVFQRWRISINQAIAWRQAGVDEGLQAAQWLTAGVTHDSVSKWRDAGIDAGQAVHWHEIGFGLAEATDALRRGLTPDTAFGSRAGQFPGSHPGNPIAFNVARLNPGVPGDVIRRFIDAGVSPKLMHEYLSSSWEAAEALPWARAGVPATDAVVWDALGLTAAEAGRLAGKGASAIETVRDWWRAGIPFDEVADWIGAGLTAKEAADQRGRGITAEQAATLRALRNSGDEDC
jgi:hypothetical protein